MCVWRMDEGVGGWIGVDEDADGGKHGILFSYEIARKQCTLSWSLRALSTCLVIVSTTWVTTLTIRSFTVMYAKVLCHQKHKDVVVNSSCLAGCLLGSIQSKAVGDGTPYISL